MHARVSRMWGSPARDSELADQASRSMAEIQAMPGCLGGYVMMDKANGRILAISLWDSAESLEANAEAGYRLRMGLADASGSVSEPNVENYEVILVIPQPGHEGDLPGMG